jgi:hypothetical protein
MVLLTSANDAKSDAENRRASFTHLISLHHRGGEGLENELGKRIQIVSDGA